MPLDAERKRLTAELAAAAPPPPVIELHPQAVAQYRAEIEELASRLNSLDPRADADLHVLVGKLISRVIVHDLPAGRANVEGRLSELLGPVAEKLGGLVGSGGGI